MMDSSFSYIIVFPFYICFWDKLQNSCCEDRVVGVGGWWLGVVCFSCPLYHNCNHGLC